MENKKILVIATQNSGKLKEFSRILEPLGFVVQSMAQAGVDLDIEESGSSFTENAQIKALAIFRKIGGYCLADDSGLCVDALDGAPGVYSARYMGEDTGYDIKIRGLLSALSTVPDQCRGAQFICSIVCITPDGTQQVFEDVCTGRIGYEPKGNKGFGYDPIFMVGKQSFAEIADSEKDKMSHRGKAIAAFYSWISVAENR